jgi:hypothetical protein
MAHIMVHWPDLLHVVSTTLPACLLSLAARHDLSHQVRPVFPIFVSAHVGIWQRSRAATPISSGCASSRRSVRKSSKRSSAARLRSRPMPPSPCRRSVRCSTPCPNLFQCIPPFHRTHPPRHLYFPSPRSRQVRGQRRTAREPVQSLHRRTHVRRGLQTAAHAL